MDRPAVGGGGKSRTKEEMAKADMQNRQRMVHQLRTRYLRDKEDREADKEERKARKSGRKVNRKRRVDKVKHVFSTFQDLPSEFLFWTRVVSMLKASATQHGVKLKFSDIFAPFAERALAEEKGKIAAGDVKPLLRRNEAKSGGRKQGERKGKVVPRG